MAGNHGENKTERWWFRRSAAMKVTIYHKPRCSKSRAALDLLIARGVAPEIVPYLETPPTPARLRALLNMLGLPPRALLRRQEAAYREAGLDDETLPDERIIAAMIEHPILIERPIVVVAKDGRERAALGRPPEAILDLL
jgi:arsenate reductase